MPGIVVRRCPRESIGRECVGDDALRRAGIPVGSQSMVAELFRPSRLELEPTSDRYYSEAVLTSQQRRRQVSAV